jgi:UDP-N-acetylglucosamine 2-epimerase
VLYCLEYTKKQISLDAFGLSHQNYTLWTLHRQDNPERLNNILSAFCEIAKDLPLILPLHSRFRVEQ